MVGSGGTTDEPSPAPAPDAPSPAPPPDAAATREEPLDDATAVHPAVGPSGTTVMPAVPPPPGTGAETGRPVWSARAQVPQAASDDTAADGEGYYEEPPARGLVAPVLVGLAVVALLVAIGFGAWLVVRGLQGDTPTPPVGPTRPSATTPPATTTKPAPSPTVTTTTPAAVPVPDLRGQDYAAAANTLTGLGLKPQRVNESSTTVAAGKVIRTDPGGFVLSGTTITVVVSSGPPPSPSPSPSPKKS